MNHWARHAVQWNLLGPPLRPGPADIAEYECRLRGNNPVADALVLGVTPELIGLPWPAGARVLAVDRSADMIRHNGPADAICADWCNLPLADGSFDAAFGDGSLNALAGPAQLTAFTGQMRRVLRPGGRLVLRVSVRPDTPEPTAAVFTDLFAGRIGVFHAFKWRLAMALHGTLAQGVQLARVWDCWHAHVPDPPALMRALGWDLDLPNSIDVYRGVPACYTFPTRTELTALFAEMFEEISWQTQDYELGERCPIIEWRR